MNRKFSMSIGYSPLELVDPVKLLQVIRVNKTIIDQYFNSNKGDMILVAGAGSGQEALLVKKEFQLKTIGVDLNIENDRGGFADNEEGLALLRQDLGSLAFDKNLFALVYCYHVLEHVKNHYIVLKELCRVMKPGGILFIGFPNKHRMISYIGTSQKVSTREKLRWNINDLKFRMRGKFENKYGAHAGFTEKEFIKDALSVFEKVIPVRNKYMQTKYPKLRKIFALINKFRLDEIVFPSNYFICIKKFL